MRINDMPEFKDKNQVMTFDKDTIIAMAIDKMAEQNYGAILVLDKDKPCGIFTERDLLRRVCAKRIDLEKSKLSEVMTKELRTASINDEVSHCLRRMSQGRFRHMPVLDEHGNLKGMLSQGDFVAYTLSDAIYRAGIYAKVGMNKKISPTALAIGLILYSIALLVIFRIILL